MVVRKRFGQNFLIDEVVIEDIATAIAISDQDQVLEIGPGRGALTEVLYNSVAAKYRAVEIDRDLIEALSARFPHIDLVDGDILKLPIDELLCGSSWRIIGNLPYNISTPLLVRLFGFSEAICDMHFMLQKEVGQRLSASPGTKQWGRLSVLAQFHCNIEELFFVGPESFRPAPKVDSSFLRLVPRKDKPYLEDEKNLSLVLRHAFSGRRKRIRNSLKMLNISWQTLSLCPDKRADQLTVDDYVILANEIALRRED
ncbi:MAG: 16S rRNA (adenine(1518)-N(6)/adenine(1519)-N(6))-dimethyltransferase [Gammaproteobacteria bacterium]|nr:16S rRNA (adenine(1518)-N(6)/adenine(1519)-N(6))-dimethyltransferase [Gammaproteobacteria bacterium]